VTPFIHPPLVSDDMKAILQYVPYFYKNLVIVAFKRKKGESLPELQS
jgi:hypothetical protein